MGNLRKNGKKAWHWCQKINIQEPFLYTVSWFFYLLSTKNQYLPFCLRLPSYLSLSQLRKRPIVGIRFLNVTKVLPNRSWSLEGAGLLYRWSHVRQARQSRQLRNLTSLMHDWIAEGRRQSTFLLNWEKTCKPIVTPCFVHNQCIETMWM